MTMLISDATNNLHSQMGSQTDLPFEDLIYADDTLVLGVHQDGVQAFMSLIQKAALNYGLSLNWRKLELLPVRCEVEISKPDGDLVASQRKALYIWVAYCLQAAR